MLKKPPEIGGLTHKIRKIVFSYFRCPVFAFSVSRFIGDVRPWAQISYNQQFGENIWKAQSGLSRMTAGNQAGNWLDVTVGADVLLNPHLAAYAAFSQAENSATDSDYLYTLGVSARF